MLKLCFVLVDRANYGRLKPVMQECQKRHLPMDVVCGGSMVLSRFKRPVDIVKADGFRVTEELLTDWEGSTPASMAMGIGSAVQQFTGAFERLAPDLVVIIGDRFEALGAAIAAATTNRCILHLQGGEVSGSIDESYRHAITKLAHYHVPATGRAKENIIRMGERAETVLAVGCPSADIAAGINVERGDHILVAYHPTTTHWQTAAEEVREVLAGVRMAAGERPVKVMWPNIDAGSDAIAKAMRENRHKKWAFLTNVPPEEYAHYIAAAACCVGNSSSFVRDAGFYGTPVVLVGDRQRGRENDHAIQVFNLRAEHVANGIEMAAESLYRNIRQPSDLYGRPGVSREIVDAIERIEPYTQKRLFMPEVACVP